MALSQLRAPGDCRFLATFVILCLLLVELCCGLQVFLDNYTFSQNFLVFLSNCHKNLVELEAQVDECLGAKHVKPGLRKLNS